MVSKKTTGKEYKEIVEKIWKKRVIDDNNPDDWYEYVLDEISNRYAEGYIIAKIETLTDSIDSSSKLFYLEILEFAEHDIWE